jgi:glucosamine--fructose-6-phosphate aminotransferase (isomerizing)
MCGIVGAIAERDVYPILLEGLSRLEYRGYDSAGLAILDTENQLNHCKVAGKVKALQDAILAHPLLGRKGIAHTRWATHGKPEQSNAHPIMSHQDEVAVVHNGIIENHEPLRARLVELGYTFRSETDTEVIVHLIHHYLKQGEPLVEAVKRTVGELRGAFALGVAAEKFPEEIIAVRSGCPLLVGIGIGENFFASDQLALQPVTHRFMSLEEGDIAVVKRNQVEVHDKQGKVVTRPIVDRTGDMDMSLERGQYRHFMQKEIFEQPQALRATLAGRMSETRVLEETFGVHAAKIFDAVQHIQFVACGTSYHAAMVAKYWVEALANIPCSVEIASEYRYRQPVVPHNSFYVTLSQSGETADTLAALQMAKGKDYLSELVICNAPNSAMVRESDLVFLTHAGREIGVASTKAFTTQLSALFLLTLVLGRRHQMNVEQEAKLVKQLRALPEVLEKILQLDETIKTLAQQLIEKEHCLFLGRGAQYPVALEGALKLKEISYIHAEAYPAGELKHGPLALVDNEMPVVVMMQNDGLVEKIKSNIQEVNARGGHVYAFVDEKIDLNNSASVTVIKLPSVDPLLAPIAYTIPLQLLSYHVGVLKGTDVDQPRNLAKSVTVE